MSQTNPSDEMLADLTEAQREAVTHLDGPMLVVAAAGSGKTRVITRRVAYLLRQGIAPESILSITFTNKAAGEMKERISAASPRPIRDQGRLDQPWPLICTFHSLCLRILKFYAADVGLKPNFSVFDSSDQSKLIKEAIKGMDMGGFEFPPAAIHAVISKAKNRLQDAQAFAQDVTDRRDRLAAAVYLKYQNLLAANNALDFDDLLMRTAHAMRDYPQILRQLQERFAYILIDEYQDTNHAQYVIAHALALRHRNICVVGDPDQSIYGWRGADLHNILNFEKDYPDAKVIRLEQNYRSTKTILAIADKLISCNTMRKEKKLWTENAQGENATVLFCQDEHEEAQAVTKKLQDLAKEQIPWSDMAIFYRVNALSRVMEDALRRAQVPYQIARGVEFYNRKEIKDVLAYLRVIANPSDAVSLTRIINIPTRGIGDGTVDLLEANALAAGNSIWETLQRAGQIQGVSTRALNGIARFVQLIETLRSNKGSVRQIMEAVVVRSGMEAMLRKEDPDAENELANVNELISAAAEFDETNPEATLDDYLAGVSLVSDADHLEGSGGAVTLMTLHAAKGLEFPVVAIIGMEEGLLPHSRAQENADELEEERRLCFVGITRAQKRLIMSKALYRAFRGKRERTVPSQFFGQMPRELLDCSDMATSYQDNWDRDEAKAEVSDQGMFHIGQRVRHRAFGLGKIRNLTESGSGTRAVVDFERVGQKVLILEYAPVTPA